MEPRGTETPVGGPAPVNLLNASQRSAIEITLALVEEDLREITRVLKRPMEQGHMVHEEDDLPESVRAECAHLVAQALSLVGEGRAAFGLSPRVTRRSQMIAAPCPKLSVFLMESEAKRLEGYGGVHPDLSTRLDPLLESLGEVITALDRSVRPFASRRGR